MAAQTVEFRMYPQQDAPGGRWHWVIERLRVNPKQEAYATKPEARTKFYAHILQAHEAGYVVYAQITDQTGAGHKTKYNLDGTMDPETPIPAQTGDLGPRCSLLPRGADQKGNGAGGKSASARRKTLAARTGWDDLYDMVKAGKIKILVDGSFAKATSPKPGVIADLHDFRYLASRILAGNKSAKAFGSYPGTFALPGPLLKDNVSQRDEAAVLARAAKAKGPTPAAADKKPGRQSSKKPPVRVPTGNTPRVPTGNTPRVPTGKTAPAAPAPTGKTAKKKAAAEKRAATIAAKKAAAAVRVPTGNTPRVPTGKTVRQPTGNTPAGATVMFQPPRKTTPLVVPAGPTAPKKTTAQAVKQPTPKQPTPRVPTPVQAPRRTQGTQEQPVRKTPTAVQPPRKTTPPVLPGPAAPAPVSTAQQQQQQAKDLAAILLANMDNIF